MFLTSLQQSLRQAKAYVGPMAAYLACATMVFSPLAMGKEAEKLNQQRLQAIVKDLGLNQKTTLGEFWAKTKNLYPPHVVKGLESYVAANKNLKMPEVTVSTVKATDGTSVPVVTVNDQGKLTTMQILGEKDKWAKYNKINLSEDDIENFMAIGKRIEASDTKIRNELDKARGKQGAPGAKLKKASPFEADFARFEGFPRITPQMWGGLKPEERVGYIMKMRLMWDSARKVMATKGESAAPKKTSSLEEFYRNIFGQDANAQAGGDAVEIGTKATTAARTNIPFTAKSCVVAGYIGEYEKVDNVNGKNRLGCSVDVGISKYRSNEKLKFVQEANDFCEKQKNPDYVACNPIIYGYPKGPKKGEPICISRKEAAFQTATHFDGVCDRESPLSSSAQIIQFSKKDYSDVKPEAKRIDAIEADQKKQDYLYTTEFLKGMLAKRDPLLMGLFEKGEWNLELDNRLVEIQSQFEQEIRRATDTCRADYLSGRQEKNQKEACDQLHRRWLFTEREIARLRTNACHPTTKYVGAYDKNEMVSGLGKRTKQKTELNKKNIDAEGTNLCQCISNVAAKCKDPSGKCTDPQMQMAARRVNFGQACPDAVTSNPPPPPGKVDECPTGMVPTNGKCMCPTSTLEIPLNEAVSRAKTDGGIGKLCPDSDYVVPGAKCEKTSTDPNFDSEKCDCKEGTGTLTEENGKWICKKDSVWPIFIPILIGGPLILLAIKNRSKPTPVIPVIPVVPPTCKLICMGQTVLDPASCSCKPTVVPPSCAPKTGVYPNCACSAAAGASCVQGQGMYDYNSCVCTPPQQIICPGGLPAPANNLALCTEGGKGDSCANPPCSGGVPAPAK